jgi:PAT family beta-lactamase induction signal transducer AmpG
MFAEQWSWQGVYLALAVLQLLLVVVTWQASEPNVPPEAPKSLHDAVVRPFQEFWRARGQERAVAVLLFIVFFKWGVYLVSTMSTPFLLDLKFTMTEVGAVLGGAGLIATLLGTMAGGVALTRFKLLPALWIFGILQAACGLLFWGLALHGHNLAWMTFAVIAENFFMGMGTAALVAFLMQECDVRFSATQFALLSSLMAVGRDLLTAPAGDLAKLVGWPIFFLLTLVASVPGLLLLAWISRMPALPNQESVRTD